jgi:hypothetical protein
MNVLNQHAKEQALRELMVQIDWHVTGEYPIEDIAELMVKMCLMRAALEDFEPGNSGQELLKDQSNQVFNAALKQLPADTQKIIRGLPLLH